MKNVLRRTLRARRRSLSEAEHAARSTRAANVIAHLSAFKSGARIALYLPFDAETSTRTLLAAARRRNIHVYVPVVSDRRRRRMRFYPLHTRLRRGTYGLAVPQALRRALTPRWFDLIVVPLVGVDADGRRLGLGGGFYDRALAYRGVRRHWRGPPLVGLAFDCQRVPTVFADPWDVRLDALATESGLTIFWKRA